jgi:drug/metabolite transporter (DMT)-like permease
MKISLYEALAIAITGQVLYHVTQKMVAPGAHPILSVLIFYGVASVLCLPLFWFFPIEGSFSNALGQMNWAVFGVAAAIVLIEVGFLLLYRLGGELSTSFLITSSVTMAMMVLIGGFFFKEHFSMTKIAGVAMCMLGIGLISWKAA